MKNDLTCAVVRDLLPSYVEGLTSEETNEAVDAHLAQCPDCAARRDAMTAPEDAAEQAETAKEVDYLKTVKRRNRRRVVLSVVFAVVLLLAGFGLKVFYIGTQAQEQGLNVLSAAVDNDNTLHLRIASVWSGTAYHSWMAEQTGGRVDIWARQVTASPLCREDSADLGIPLDGLEEVYLCGRLIWQDGTIIEYSNTQIYALRTPYVGDAPAAGRLFEEIDRWHGPIGRRSFSLQTSSQPYGMTVELDGTRFFRQGEPPILYRYSVRLLALVENLDYVSWVYTDAAGGTQCLTITQEDALDYIRLPAAVMDRENDLRDSIKAYAASMLDFQKLCNLTDSRG
ncbi:MAG: DUF4825 domain-containing protein [Oscillospiraceae bacterium]|nr:DUF4825 domain-containing protein [Oscillospiraceae bacterium]